MLPEKTQAPLREHLERFRRPLDRRRQRRSGYAGTLAIPWVPQLVLLRDLSDGASLAVAPREPDRAGLSSRQ